MPLPGRGLAVVVDEANAEKCAKGTFHTFVVDVRVPVVFPPGNLLIALIGTIALALLVLLLPVRRAARFHPGDALRCA